MTSPCNPAEIDFKPGVFDSPKDKKKTKSLFYYAAWLTGGALLISGIGVGIVLMSSQKPSKTSASMPKSESESYLINNGPIKTSGNIAVGSQPFPAFQGQQQSSQGFCDGSDLLCSVVITKDPASALNKLTSTLPSIKKNTRYKVKLMIYQVDEPDYSESQPNNNAALPN
jgi:hypothetical protein